MGGVRDVAVVSFAQTASVRRVSDENETEMLMPVVQEAIARSGIPKKEIGFTVSGSSDYLSGIPFSFVFALDAIGAWPPISESHVEMDGAFALYEAWVRLQHGDVDSALVYSFGKSSTGDVRDILCLQLDPYYQAPLWPDPVSLAAIQARAYLERSGKTERDLAEVAVRSRKSAKQNSKAQLAGDFDVDAILADPYLVSPLRKHDCPPISDGAAVVMLAAGDLARRVCKRPAWIRGIDHRIEAHSIGSRDLTRSSSTKLAGERAGLHAAGAKKIDTAELHAPFSHQELILREALDLDGPSDNDENIAINPSGGALAANPIMVAGLSRIGEAAQRILDGKSDAAVAHATSGPCLQQNLVCVLEAR